MKTVTCEKCGTVHEVRSWLSLKCLSVDQTTAWRECTCGEKICVDYADKDWARQVVHNREHYHASVMSSAIALIFGETT